MKRIRYVPGLLSLALMLPLVLWYLSSQRAFRQLRCFTMAFPPVSDTTGAVQLILWHPEASDTIPDYRCTGSLNDDRAVLLAFRDSIECLARRDDQRTVLHVRFGSKASYASVIHAIESCRRNTRTWMLDGSDLWTTYLPKETTSTSFASVATSNPILMCGTDFLPKPWWQTFMTDELRPLADQLRSIWLAVPLYLLLTYIGLRRAFGDSWTSPK